MPYITCGDGKVYSRYDNHPFVKECIESEHQYYKTINKAHKNNNSCDLMFFGVFIIFFIILFKIVNWLGK